MALQQSCSKRLLHLFHACACREMPAREAPVVILPPLDNGEEAQVGQIKMHDTTPVG
jgi:hypothetical protein